MAMFDLYLLEGYTTFLQITSKLELEIFEILFVNTNFTSLTIDFQVVY